MLGWTLGAVLGASIGASLGFVLAFVGDAVVVGSIVPLLIHGALHLVKIR